MTVLFDRCIIVIGASCRYLTTKRERKGKEGSRGKGSFWLASPDRLLRLLLDAAKPVMRQYRARLPSISKAISQLTELIDH